MLGPPWYQGQRCVQRSCLEVTACGDRYILLLTTKRVKRERRFYVSGKLCDLAACTEYIHVPILVRQTPYIEPLHGNFIPVHLSDPLSLAPFRVVSTG